LRNLPETIIKRFLHGPLPALILTIPLMAQAAVVFSFDPDGAGAGAATSGAAAINQAAGNALSINGAYLQPGVSNQVLYQANLSTIVDNTGAGVFTNGSAGRFFTFVLGFYETPTSVNNNFDNTLRTSTFGIDTTKSSFFYMYVNTVSSGDNLTGQGFTNGNVILSGQVAGTNFNSNFSEILVGGLRSATNSFDDSGSNDYSGVTTVAGAGSKSISIDVNFIDQNYFPDLSLVDLDALVFNMNTQTPFEDTDPSRVFSSNGLANGDVASNIGPQNGISGPNLQVQALANASFGGNVAAVPEPGTLGLVSLALAGLALRARRRKI
jgi:hypothetical protein